jgi:uncharacterized membrane protein
MSWLQRYRLREFFTTSLWFVPVISMLMGVGVSRVMRIVDELTHWTLLGFGVDGGKAVLSIATQSTLSIIIFAASVILVVVQIASSQLSPRIIARIFRDRITKMIIGLFIFTYMYTLAVLGRTEATINQLSLAVAILLSFASVAAFLYLLDYMGKVLRPVALSELVAFEAIELLNQIYPASLSERAAGVGAKPAPAATAPPRIVTRNGRSGVLLAVDFAGLKDRAVATRGAVELIPQVGDFVARGDPVFRLHGGSVSLTDRELMDSVALGPERTMEQDPGFAFRILVDIASRALSPAINDPTTAVSALDQIHRLLRYIGGRQLDNGVVTDKDGKVRLLYPTPDWEDIVCLATSEIRLFGVSSLQVARRLRAMLEHLIAILPPPRIPALRQEMELVQAAVERSYSDAADRRLAGLGDLQGVGGQERQKVVSFKSE